MPEIVFVLVGVYLIALPAFGRKSGSQVIAGNVSLHIARMASGVRYRLGGAAANNGDLRDLDAALRVVAGRSPKPVVRIVVGRGVSAGEVLAATRLCTAAGLEVVYADSGSSR